MRFYRISARPSPSLTRKPAGTSIAVCRPRNSISTATRSRPGMTASQAEAWCLESLAISAAGLAPDRPFYLRLEMRAAGPKEQFSNVMADPVRAFIELLSRKAGPGEQHWGPLDSRPLRLTDLVRVPGPGARTG